ncbi:Poly(A) RNA polymerase gld-2 -like protein A [Halotydeus destructor]|nr:Poly(A) RNA polymerase gld-2 -like protein A [Halotydeus destructor]
MALSLKLPGGEGDPAVRLQKLHPDLFNELADIRPLQLGAKWPIHESNNKCSVGELFVEFIHYFANTFNYEEDAISVRTGKLIPKQVTRMYKSPKNSPADLPFLAIEEPFDRTKTALLCTIRSFSIESCQYSKTPRHAYVRDIPLRLSSIKQIIEPVLFSF